MVRIELYILSQIKMEKYKRGMMVKMKVFTSPSSDGPGYTLGMMEHFRRNPMVEINGVYYERGILYVVDDWGSTWSIIPEWIEQSEVVLFI